MTNPVNPSLDELIAWRNASLIQAAAESHLQDGSITENAHIRRQLLRGNTGPDVTNPSEEGYLRFAQTAQADEFLRRYAVIDQHPNDATGFSATVLQDTQSGRYVIAFRSTEYRLPEEGKRTGDHHRDALQGADGELAGTLAWGQIESMRRYYERLQQGLTSLDPDTGLARGEATPLNTALRDALQSSATIDVVGFSLGGHLAGIFTELYTSKVNRTFLFNSAGRSQIGNATGLAQSDQLDAALATFRSVLANPASISLSNQVLVDNPGLLPLRAKAIANPWNASQWLSPDPQNFADEAGRQPLNAYKNFQAAAYQFAAAYTSKAYTFSFALGTNNALGVTGLRGHDKITQLYGHATHDDFEVTANSGLHPQAAPIFIEGQPIVEGLGGMLPVAPELTASLLGPGDFGNTHSLTLVIDSLELMVALKRIDPTLTKGQIEAMFAAASHQRAKPWASLNQDDMVEGDTLERILDGLRRVLLSPNEPETTAGSKTGDFGDVAARAVYYRHIQDLVGAATGLQSGGSRSIKVIPLVPGDVLATDYAIPADLAEPRAQVSPFAVSNVAAKAKQSDAEGLAYRHALVAGNPFAVLIHDSTGDIDVAATQARYAGFNSAGELDLYDPATRTGALTAAFLDERAGYLARLLDVNLHNIKTPDDPTAFPGDRARLFYADEDRVYFDAASNTRIVKLPNLTAQTAYYLFGGATTDVLTGGGAADKLFGGAGVDILTGKGGNDMLEGGAGMDVYVYAAGDGSDTIVDTDGRGLLRYTWNQGGSQQSMLIGDASVWKSSTQWTSADGRIVYDKVAGEAAGVFDLRIGLTGAPGGGGGTVTVRDFDFAAAEAGMWMGVALRPATTQVAVNMINPTILGGVLAVNGQGQYYIDPNNGGNWAVVAGTLDNDVANTLTGTVGGDHIRSGGGNDTVNANQGGTQPDIIDLGTGNDTATAGAGNDHVLGGAGNDNIYAGLGNDWVIAGDDSDLVEAGNGDDLLEGGLGADILFGEAGRDRLYSGDEITWQALAGDPSLLQGSGSSTTKGEWLDGGAEDDIVFGGADADLILGGGGTDLLVGGGGNDDIYGDGGTIAPLSAVDRGWYVTRTTTSNNNILVTTLTIHNGSSDATGRGINNGQGNEGEADLIYGGAGDDWLFGGGGDDHIDGGDGDDIVSGNRGADRLVLGAGNDFGAGDSVDTTLSGYPSTSIEYNDYIDGGDGNDSLVGYFGADILLGGRGVDTLVGDGSTNTGWDGADLLDGGDGDDFLYGFGGADTLIGGKGDDYLNGGYGKDIYHFNRGDGRDTLADEDDIDLQGGPPSLNKSIIVLGEGIKREDVKFRKGSLLVDFGDGDGIHLTLPLLATDPAARPLFDQLRFADGSALVWVDLLAKGFELDGTSGNDTIIGTSTIDRINGGAGDDTISGFAGNDILDGGADNDTFDGGLGDDLLLGGAGNDIYVVDFNAGRDVATDTSGSNSLNVGYLDLTELTLGRSGNDLVLSGRGQGTTGSFTITGGYASGGMAGWTVNADGSSVSLAAFAGTGPLSSSADLAALTSQYDARWTTAYGAGFAPRVTGNANANIQTMTIASVVDGAGGNDTITMNRAAGVSYLRGAVGSLLVGDSGDDAVVGGGDDDILVGGTGDNALDGGMGEDHYVVFDGGGVDTIVDRGGVDAKGQFSNDVMWSTYLGPTGGIDRVYLPMGVTAA
jgi:Ca2+-binding RTX toxin-like protein